MNIHVDISGALAEAVGRDDGVTEEEFQHLEGQLRAAHNAMSERKPKAHYAFLDLYKDTATLERIERTAGKLAGREFENLVVLGIGGSALGLITLVQALKPAYHNLLSRGARGGCPRVFVMDTIDPSTFAQMLSLCPPRKTLFNVISKSGTTSETVAQLMIVIERLEKELGRSALRDHLVITTGRGRPNVLADVKREYKLPGFAVPANVGGRYSVFSPVGLFPAALLGMNIGQLASGCAAMAKRCAKFSLLRNPACARAAVKFLAATHKGKAISVMMPYGDSLAGVADFYGQLWAESLGKGTPRRGAPAAQTPVKAVGVRDQHSQLQLYLEGPNDKIITVVQQGRFSKTLPIPKVLKSSDGPEGLRGSTLDKLLAAECKATVEALRQAKRPVMQLGLPRVNEHTVAQLLYMLEMETALAGLLFKVNAFNQPAVEQIKVLTRRYMRR